MTVAFVVAAFVLVGLFDFVIFRRLGWLVHEASLHTKTLAKLQGGIASMSSAGVTAAQALADLTAQVEANTSAENSATTMIAGLIAQLAAANAAQTSGVDPNAVEKLIANLQASQAPLAAAITANTPAAPPSA
jgi:hypothetical protein